MRKEVLKLIEELEHTVEDGFYDSDLDLYFRDLGDWLQYQGYGWKDIL